MRPREPLLDCGCITRAFHVDIPRKDAYRMLQGSRRRALRSSIAEVLEEELSTARELITPKAIVRASERSLHGAWGSVPGPLAAVLCTIGDALEHRVEDLLDSAESTRALALDAVGSASLGEARRLCERWICEWALQEGLFVRDRIEPGGPECSLEAQRLIFDFLGSRLEEIELSEALMMRPLKTLSFFLPLSRDRGAGETVERRCTSCDCTDCVYRDEGGRTT